MSSCRRYFLSSEVTIVVVCIEATCSRGVHVRSQRRVSERFAVTMCLQHRFNTKHKSPLRRLRLPPRAGSGDLCVVEVHLVNLTPSQHYCLQLCVTLSVSVVDEILLSQVCEFHIRRFSTSVTFWGQTDPKQRSQGALNITHTHTHTGNMLFLPQPSLQHFWCHYNVSLCSLS